MKLFEAINVKQWDSVVTAFHEEGSLIFPGSSPLSGFYQGRESIRRYFRRMNIAVPDLRFEVLQSAESENIVILEWRNRGKTRKGIPYENKGVTVLEFRGDELWQLRDYLDTEKLKAGNDEKKHGGEGK
jgi:ketosteroid isomerase-like protein